MDPLEDNGAGTPEATDTPESADTAEVTDFDGDPAELIAPPPETDFEKAWAKIVEDTAIDLSGKVGTLLNAASEDREVVQRNLDLAARCVFELNGLAAVGGSEEEIAACERKFKLATETLQDIALKHRIEARIAVHEFVNNLASRVLNAGMDMLTGGVSKVSKSIVGGITQGA